MGLYLCVFDDDAEVEGVEVGSYDDFSVFRQRVTELLEGKGGYGSRFPTLLLHSDSDGEWTLAQCKTLRLELETIATEFRRLPSMPFHSDWQQKVGKSLGLMPESLFDSFIDVDGELLLERLIGLCDVAISRSQPILFQ
jgi:hypothetical protein